MTGCASAVCAHCAHCGYKREYHRADGSSMFGPCPGYTDPKASR